MLVTAEPLVDSSSKIYYKNGVKYLNKIRIELDKIRTALIKMFVKLAKLAFLAADK